MLWDVLVGCELELFWCGRDRRVCAPWGTCSTSEGWVGAGGGTGLPAGMGCSLRVLPKTGRWRGAVVGMCLFPQLSRRGACVLLPVVSVRKLVTHLGVWGWLSTCVINVLMVLRFTGMKWWCKCLQTGG